MEKMSRSDRAKQFMPFAALRGYGAELRGKEKVISERKELTDEQAEELSRAVSGLKKGDIVKVFYYSLNGYVEMSGAVSFIDPVRKILRVIKTEIAFFDIYSIEKTEN